MEYSVMVFFALVLLLYPPGIPAADTAVTSEDDTGRSEIIQPVILPGAQLGNLLNKPIPLVRVFASHSGVLAPIPFQIDQVDSRGDWVWDVIFGKYLVSGYEDDLHEGIGNLEWRAERNTGVLDDEDNGTQKTVDSNDVLVFMEKDMGDRVLNVERRLSGASLILEVERQQAAGNRKAWAYIGYFPSDPPAYSPLRYVRYLPESATVVSDVYAIGFSQQHIAVLDQLEIDGIPLMDRTKLRGSMFLGRRDMGKNVDFDENDIHGHTDGYIDGPVRVIRRNSASLRFAGIFSSPEISCDQYFYVHHSEIPLTLPVNFLVERLSLRLAADYHGNPFRRAYVSGHDLPVPLRNRTSAATNLLEDAGSVRWMALTGNDASIVSTLTLPDAIKPFAEVMPYLRYDINAGDPPENHPGSEPEAGYLIRTKPGFPRGGHTIRGTYLYLARPFRPSDARQLLEVVENRAVYRLTQYQEPGGNRATRQWQYASGGTPPSSPESGPPPD